MGARLGLSLLPKSMHSRFLWGLAVFVTLFELYENTERQIKKYRRIEIDSKGVTTYRGDSTINIIDDLMANFFGIWLAMQITSSLESFAVLLALFLLVTRITGLSYWTDFVYFMLKARRKAGEAQKINLNKTLHIIK